MARADLVPIRLDSAVSFTTGGFVVDPDSVPPTGIGRYDNTFPDIVPPRAEGVPPADSPPGPVLPVPPPRRAGSGTGQRSPRSARRTLIAVLVTVGILVRILWFFHNVDNTVGRDDTVTAPAVNDTDLVLPATPGPTSSSPFWTIVAPTELDTFYIHYVYGADQTQAEQILQSLSSQGVRNPTVTAYDVDNDPQSHLVFYGVALLDGTLVPADKISTTFDELRRGSATVSPPLDAMLPAGYGTAQCAAVTKAATHQLVCIWRVSTAYVVFTFTGTVPTDTYTAGKTLTSIIQDIAQPY